MSTPGLDWAPLYQKHRAAMFGVALKVLREGSRTSEAEDVVQDAFMSVMANPPLHVKSWEALLVTAAKRRAIDRLRSADFRHAGGGLDDDYDPPDESDEFEKTTDAIDRHREAARVWDALAILDTRHRYVASEYIAHQRSRDEVAAQLGVTPARVSQMAKTAIEALRQELEKQ